MKGGEAKLPPYGASSEGRTGLCLLVTSSDWGGKVPRENAFFSCLFLSALFFSFLILFRGAWGTGEKGAPL